MQARHIKTGNIYDIVETKVINCNEDVQAVDRNRKETVYCRGNKVYVQNTVDFDKKFEYIF